MTPKNTLRNFVLYSTLVAYVLAMGVTAFSGLKLGTLGLGLVLGLTFLGCFAVKKGGLFVLRMLSK